MSEQSIPGGMYKGRAVFGSEQYGTTSNGNDQIAIDVDVPALSRQLTVFLYFSENGAQYAIEKLRACGWAGDDLADLRGVDANEVDVSIKYEPYRGEIKMKVDIYAGGGRVKLDSPMDEKQKRAFAARMKGVIKGGAPAPKPPANGRQPQAMAPKGGGGGDAGEGDDGIPF
jgi:hypothetical protein